MRRYGLYDATRGLMTALAVGVAGLLLWCATQVGQQSTARFWEAMGIVAAAGLVLALLPALGGWTSGLRLRLSPGTFLLGFIPTLVVVGFVLLATQPGNGWHEGRFISWSHSLGVMGVVHSLGLWHGVLAFGFGTVLGLSLDSVPALEPVDQVVVDRERTIVDERRPRWTSTDPADPADPAYPAAAADEPLTAEQRAAQAEPRTVAVGPANGDVPARERVDTVD